MKNTHKLFTQKSFGANCRNNDALEYKLHVFFVQILSKWNTLPEYLYVLYSKVNGAVCYIIIS